MNLINFTWPDGIYIDQNGMLRGSMDITYEDFVNIGGAGMDRYFMSRADSRNINFLMTLHCNPEHLSAEEHCKIDDSHDVIDRAHGLDNEHQRAQHPSWGDKFREEKDDDGDVVQTVRASLVLELDNQIAGHVVMIYNLSHWASRRTTYFNISVPAIHIVPAFRHKRLWMPLYTGAWLMIYSAMSEAIRLLPKHRRLMTVFSADYDTRAGEILGRGLYDAIELVCDSAESGKRQMMDDPIYDAGY